LSKFVDDKTREFNYSYLGEVTRFVIRFMNNIIDRNYYPERIPQIKYANLKNRPLGIGIQGLANTFAKMELLFDSEEAREVNDKIIQTIYYYAVDESANLAQQFGSYPAFEGSPYSKGLLHPDIWRAPNGDRSEFLDCYDWSSLRIKASKGMRNSTLLALMPTATSSIIAEQSPCFEPFNFIVGSKSLISGQYTVVCKEFVEDMQKLGVWNDDFAKQIYFDPDNNIGSIQNIKIPDSIKDSPLKVARWNFLMDKYRTAYEIGARESIKQALQRTPFVCQSQSTNWFVGKPSFNKWFKNVIGSWERGAKTCMYYMRGNSSMKARAAMACEGCTG
jgi:ribonucleotide reductase alpha subunit